MDNTVANWRLACLITLGAFLGLSVAAFATGPLPGDLALREGLMEPNSSLAHEFAKMANQGGTWRVILPASLLILLLSRYARQRWWLWAAILLTSPLLEHAVKFLVARPRPSGFSLGFPSGHTTGAATFAVLLVYIVSREPLTPAWRHAIQALAIAMMVLVGWARIVLHAHWPTDVLGGFLLGTGCAAAGAWWDTTRPETAPRDSVQRP